MIVSKISDKSVEMDEEKIPIEFYDNDNEVLGKLVLKLVPGADGPFGAACFEPPPEYCEKDPLQLDGADDVVNEAGQETCSSNDSTATSDSFWDNDDVIDADDDTGPNWSDLDCCGRVKHVLVRWIGKLILLLLLLYVFICSLDFLSSAFRILGGKTAGGVFSNSDLLHNPVAGLMIGILATVLVQSSSTSTSIVVTMVASGIIDVQPAIPMVMGANIGTSVTNTIVSMAQSSDRREFRRAFAGATVHDMFNWLSVLVLLPLEVSTGYLYHLTKAITRSMGTESYTGGKQQLLKAATKPLTNLLVQVDKKVINKIAEGHEEYLNKSLIKKYCSFEEVQILRNITMETNVTTIINGTEHVVLANVTQEIAVTEKVPVEKCFSLFSHLEINETVSGILLLIFSLVLLCTCLVFMVKLLHSILQGSIAKIIKKTLNSDFPGCFGWLTGYVAMLVGAVMTVLVQSSSVFTSALTPLVGIGMIKIDRMYPLTLGSNIGTTGTGVLAAMAASGDKLPVALQIALCHLFFNISGILLFYPIKPLRHIPIRCAKYLGTVTSEYRWFAIAYLIFMFILLPGSVFILSLAGFIPSICVGSILGLGLLFIIVINVMQRKCSKILPKCIRTWPKWLSLRPVDKLIMKVVDMFTKCCPCCIRNCCVPKKPDTRVNSLVAVLVNKDPIYRRPSPTASAASSEMLLNRVSRI